LAYDPNLPSLAQLMGGAAAPAPPQRDSLGAILASNAQSAWGNFRYGLPAAIEATTGTMTPEDERYYVAWNRHHQEQAQQTAPEGAADIDDYMAGRVGLGRAFLENVTAMVPHAATAIAGGIAGTIAAPGPGTLAGAAGGLVGSAVQFTGSNAGRAMEETGGLTREQGARSIMLAPAQAALELAGARFIPGFGRFLGPLAAKFEGNIVSRTVKGAVSGALTEAATEAGQQLAERAAVGLPVTGNDALREYVNAIAVGALMGGGFGGISGGLRLKNPSEVTNEELELTLDQQFGGYLPEPTAFTDAAGRTAIGDNGFESLVATQRQPERGTVPFDMPPAPGPDPTRGPTTVLGMPDNAQQVEAPLAAPFEALPKGYEPDVFEPTSIDVLKQVPTPQLEAITKKARRKQGSVAQPVVEAVERELASRGEGGSRLDGTGRLFVRGGNEGCT
jgi:hypothetical protein